MSAKGGREAVLYYKVGGLDGAGAWTELSIVRDCGLDLQKGDADVTVRGNAGFKQYVGTLKDVPLEFEVVYDADDPGYQALQDSYIDDLIIGLAILDGPWASANGLLADFIVTAMKRNEPLDGAITSNVTAKLAYSSNVPQWMDAGATATATP